MFSNEEIDQANQVSILEYAKKLGYAPKRVGRDYKISGFGGLYIDDQRNCFNCFSFSGKGGGPIQFVMYMESLSWREAVAKLIDKDLYVYSREHGRLKVDLHTNVIPPFFELPEKSKTMKHVFAYLINTRKLDKDVVYEFVRKKMIYENTYGSCVFVGYDEDGKAKCASIRGTGTKAFKQDVSGSQKEYFFHKEGVNDTVNVFESAIDLLSYITLQRRKSSLVQSHDFDDHYVALGCLDDAALKKYLALHPEVQRIRLCLDNDEAGNKAGTSLYDKYSSCDRFFVCLDKPNRKDWNEELQFATI